MDFREVVLLNYVPAKKHGKSHYRNLINLNKNQDFLRDFLHLNYNSESIFHRNPMFNFDLSKLTFFLTTLTISL
jgi:hypothetical protein